MNWFDEYNFPVVHRDAFGGVIYFVQDEENERDEEDQDLMSAISDNQERDVDGQDDEVSASELKIAQKAQRSHLIIHANGSEIWTTSGLDFAISVLNQNITPKEKAQPQLFT